VYFFISLKFHVIGYLALEFLLLKSVSQHLGFHTERTLWP